MVVFADDYFKALVTIGSPNRAQRTFRFPESLMVDGQVSYPEACRRYWACLERITEQTGLRTRARERKAIGVFRWIKFIRSDFSRAALIAEAKELGISPNVLPDGEMISGGDVCRCMEIRLWEKASVYHRLLDRCDTVVAYPLLDPEGVAIGRTRGTRFQGLRPAVLAFCREPRFLEEIARHFGWQSEYSLYHEQLLPMQELGLLKVTVEKCFVDYNVYVTTEHGRQELEKHAGT